MNRTKRKRGRPHVEQANRRLKISFTLSQDVLEKLKKQSADDELPKSRIVDALLRKHLK